MIDFGLLLSGLVAVGFPALVADRWGLTSRDRSASFLDVVLGPLLLGLAVARIAAVLLDSPGSIGQIGEILIIRSGVEFWPGVVAAAALLFVSARRAGDPIVLLFAAVAPLAMLGAAGYEATCVVRDGCYGPASPIGLRPPGVGSTMLPVGLVMAIGLIGCALALRRWEPRHGPQATIAAAVFAVAVIRAIGSFWLPHLGSGLTRPHWTSIVVAGFAGLAWLTVSRRPLGSRGIDQEEGRRHPPPDRQVPF